MVHYKLFGNTGRKLSEIGIGTYFGPLWIAGSMMGRKSGRPEKVKSLNTALDNGITLVDTAEIYGTEEMVGEAMRGRDREEIFIASKVWPSHLNREILLKSAAASLRRLETKYIDLYQIHFPNQKVALEETMSAMMTLIKEGKIRHVGISNFSLEQAKEAAEALDGHRISSIQLPYNIYNREVESNGMFDYCSKNKMALMAYYPLAQGKVSKDQKLGEIAKECGATPIQLALRWLSQKDIVFPIPGSANPKHVVENTKAADIRLGKREGDKINGLAEE